MAQPERGYVSPEAYLQMERDAENKNEYFNGEIFAMTGASFNHNLIAVNITSSLHGALRDSPCYVLSSDMKIQVDKARHYVYPDVSIVCDRVEFSGERENIVVNPIVLFEILSVATRDYDRGSKFMAYRNVISLKDYILVDQYSLHVEHFQKNDKGQWVLDEYKSQSDAFIIKSIGVEGVELSLQNIYDRVKIEDHERRGMDKTN